MIGTTEYGSNGYIFKIFIAFIVFDIWWNVCIYIYLYIWFEYNDIVIQMN